MSIEPRTIAGVTRAGAWTSDGDWLTNIGKSLPCGRRAPKRLHVGTTIASRGAVMNACPSFASDTNNSMKLSLVFEDDGSAPAA